MKTLVAALAACSAFLVYRADADPFFEQLREAYLVVLEECVRPSSGTWSVSLAMERGGPSFVSLPEDFWKELSGRLETQGKDVAGYVKAEELSWAKGRRVIHTSTGKGAVVFHIIGVTWLGDQRLSITHSRTTGGLGALGYTSVLEKDERGWHIVDRKDGFQANQSSQATAAMPLAFDRSR
jgi:hypothetical protein